MAIKLSSEAATVLRRAVVSETDARIILQNLEGTMFYLVVGDDVRAWSADRAEIEALATGRFTFSTEVPPKSTHPPATGYLPGSVGEYVTIPSIRLTFPGLFDERDARNRRVAELEAEKSKIEAKVKRLTRSFSEMLKPLEYRRERIDDMKAINKKLGLAKLQEATTRAQVNAYGMLLAAWKMKEKAGL